MKLNLYILEDELSPTAFERHITDKIYDCRLSYPVPYIPGMALSSDYVYVVDSRILKEEASSALSATSFICIGKPPERYLKPPFSTIYTLDETDNANSMLVRCLDIFNKYQTWTNRMQKVIDDGLPLKKLATLAFPFFDNPIFLQGSGFKAIFQEIGDLKTACPEGYEKYRNSYGGTVPLQEGQRIPLDEISLLTADEEYAQAIDSDVPKIYTGSLVTYRDLYHNITVGGECVARLLIEEIKHPIRSKDFGLIMIFAHYVERGFRNQSYDYFDRILGYEETIRGLISHRYLERKVITSTLEQLQWGEFDTYCCIVLNSYAHDKHEDALLALAFSLSEELHTNCFVIYDKKLIIVINLSKIEMSKAALLKDIQPILRDNLMTGGISNQFTDFKKLYYYYIQACDAISFGRKHQPDVWFHHYDTYHLDYMLQRCVGKQLTETFIPAGLFDLIDYDKKNGSDLTKLLRIYLENNCNVTEAARKTFVGRSTCIYRLQRIDEITGFNLQDHSTRLEAMIAFKLLDYHTG